MSDKRTLLVWTDLETTGLDPEKGRVLEYALVLTDLKLNEVDSTELVVPQSTAEARSLMDDYVLKMHEGNGLLAAMEQTERQLPIPSYPESINVVDDMLVAFLEKYNDGNTIFVIAGNTVGFDKGYIKIHMPKLFDTLHYRQLDVSAYKVAFPEVFGTKTSDAHRAMGDIRASIESHSKMRSFFLAGEQALDVRSAIVSQTTFDEDDCC